MLIIDRILLLLDERSRTLKELAEYLQINTSTAYTWRQRHRNPPSEYLVSIATFLNVSPEYLLTGKTPLQSFLSDEDSRLLREFHALDAEGKAIVKATVVKERRRMESKVLRKV